MAELEDLQRRLALLLGVAVAVSVVHYVDNVVSYAAYPQSASSPNPSATVIAVSWFVFTAFGIAAFVALRRGRVLGATLLLMVYSLSGLVGIGHYAIGGTSAFPWWRHAHIVADIALGVLVLAFALRLLERSRTPA